MGTLFVDVAPEDELLVRHGDTEVNIQLIEKTGRKARLRITADISVKVESIKK